MPTPENVMRFPQITAAIENTFNGERAFLVENLDRAVAICGKHAAQFQQKTELSLKLTFDPKNDAISIVADLSAKLPNPAPFPIRAYADKDGNLVEDDPRQTTLPGVTPGRFTK